MVDPFKANFACCFVLPEVSVHFEDCKYTELRLERKSVSLSTLIVWVVQ
jgi:hypothetical protein